MAKDEHIHARCDKQRKDEYIELAESMGYDTLSAFVISLLESMRDRYLDPGWRSHLLHVSEDRIVGAEAHEGTDIPMGTSAFPVVAPDHFWDHVRKFTDSSGNESP